MGTEIRQIIRHLIGVAALLATTAGCTSGLKINDTLGSGSNSSTSTANPSSSGACISTDPNTKCNATQIVDNSFDTWTLSGGIVLKNGSAAGLSSAVTTLLYYGSTIYQENSSGGWWFWSSGSWISTSDPTVATPNGSFSVSGGQIIDPNGKIFIGRGVNIPAPFLSDAIQNYTTGAPLMGLFPGLKIVRVPIFYYDSVASLQAAITTLTNLHVVVELENHNSPNGAGGCTGAWTGSNLATEVSWYTSVAKAFKNNPYVWFGTKNEPFGGYSPDSDIEAEQVATYNAIRGAGNNNIIILEGADCGGSNARFTKSKYSVMRNVVWDQHSYAAGGPSAQSAIESEIANSILGVQSITSADGIVPVVIGEYGDSTDGQKIDPNGMALIAAVGAMPYSSMAWAWTVGWGNADALVKNDQLASPEGPAVAAVIGQK